MTDIEKRFQTAFDRETKESFEKWLTNKLKSRKNKLN